MSDFEPAESFHPGEYLRDEIHARGLNARQFAELSGIELSTVRRILRCASPVTLTHAIAISKALGTSSVTWVNLQFAYLKGEVIQQRRDLVYWAEHHGELDACWVLSHLGKLESDIAGIDALHCKIKATMSRCKIE